ncbi:MAG TPA: UDP-N-acetylmuramoyl-L-alanine--D-glutamate ligase [Planctomycetota bacterium]|nr:UDP-N-acetylmuramoyl-L-alanine--D-glutamate ligase [Planctomycetota bacterium]
MGAYAGKRVTVMGLGLFGGGVGAARFFAENGATVTVTDLRTEKDLKPSIDALAGLPIRYVLGRHFVEDFRRANIVVVNPSVTSDNPLVTMARGAGAQIEHAINLLFKLTPRNPKIGITGSNGKSTTTALVGEMMRLHDSRSLMGGNIGKCLLGSVKDLAPNVPIVLELSSFMLDGLKELGESPRVSIVTNLSPNHLDRHGSMEAYAAAKLNILNFQKSTDTAVLNADDPMLAGWENHTRGRVIKFSVKIEPEGDAAFLDGEKLVVRIGRYEEVVAVRQALRLPGIHNVANALAASAAALAYGVKPWQIAEALATFSGLPHRLEMVARGPGSVTFYNDSIATTPESAICALASFNGPITLIAGGYDKGSPFDELGIAIARKARRLILLGTTASKIEQAVLRASREMMKGPMIIHARNLEHAASLAASGVVPGEVVLLSPACASYDMFRNFQERGELFRALAQRLTKTA